MHVFTSEKDVTAKVTAARELAGKLQDVAVGYEVQHMIIAFGMLLADVAAQIGEPEKTDFFLMALAMCVDVRKKEHAAPMPGRPN